MIFFYFRLPYLHFKKNDVTKTIDVRFWLDPQLPLPLKFQQISNGKAIL